MVNWRQKVKRVRSLFFTKLIILRHTRSDTLSRFESAELWVDGGAAWTSGRCVVRNTSKSTVSVRQMEAI